MIKERDHIYYRLLNMIFCDMCKKKMEFVHPGEVKRKENMQDKFKGDMDAFKLMENEYLLKQVLRQRSEEQLKINRSKYYWSIVRKKIKVIRMMAKIGGDKVQAMNERQQKMVEIAEDTDEQTFNKFIISPGNYWNM